MSGEVITVTGAIAAGELGVTSMHEHALADGRAYAWPEEDVPQHLRWGSGAELALANRGAIARQIEVHSQNLLVDDPDLVGDELAEFREAGGEAIVDMSVPGLRLDPEALPRISRRSGVRIVAGTGLYIGVSRPAGSAERSIEELAEWMVAEIEEGIDGTDVRAGQIGELGITDLGESDSRLLRAAVRAADRTGVSISVHPGFAPGSDGLAIADVLEDEGGRPERIVICHADAFFVESSLERLVDDPSCWGLRLDYHRDLLARGYNLTVDCFGHDWGREDEGWAIETDWQRLAGLVALIREGHTDQLAIGCDVFVRSLHRRGGGAGYRYLLEWVLPRLREGGVDEAAIERLTVVNPARILTREISA